MKNQMLFWKPKQGTPHQGMDSWRQSVYSLYWPILQKSEASAWHWQHLLKRNIQRPPWPPSSPGPALSQQWTWGMLAHFSYPETLGRQISSHVSGRNQYSQPPSPSKTWDQPCHWGHHSLTAIRSNQSIHSLVSYCSESTVTQLKPIKTS